MINFSSGSGDHSITICQLSIDEGNAMRQTTLYWVFGASFLLVAVSAAPQTGLIQPPKAAAAYGKLPMTFERNQGQTSAKAQFVARGQGYSAYLTAGGMVLSLRLSRVAAETSGAVPVAHAQSPNTPLQFNLLGAAQNASVVGENQQPGRVNYFFGKDPKRWHTNVPTYGRVRYKEIYPGIDLIYHGNRQQLEYDFEVSGGGNPNLIQFEIKGTDNIYLDSDGTLAVKVNGGELRFLTPVVYQTANGQRTPIGGRYIMKDSAHIGFAIDQYDSSKPLVIDPVLTYSTYLGGSGTEYATGLAVDSGDSVYVGGYTDAADFTLSTLGSPAAGVDHVFVAKLDPTGSTLVYADYLGGENADEGLAIALDSTNNVYIAGTTQSTQFPTVNPYQATIPGANSAFLSKISPDGSTLVYSTYLGGSADEVVAGVGVDSTGSSIVTGYTTSTNFPVANAYQATASANAGGIFGNYGFLTKFSSDGMSLVYSTYLGGASNVILSCVNQVPCWPQPNSYITGMALDSADNAYVTGNTNTYDFPVTSGAYLSTDANPMDGGVGFVSKFSNAGSLQYSTYFYESSGSFTELDAIAVDGAGSAYITGMALSDGTFPLTSTTICDPAVYGQGCNYAFVTKFDPTGSSLAYSTFLGPNNYAQPVALRLDADNDAYVVATTWSNSFSLVNPIETYTNTDDSYEAILVELNPTATSELSATYLDGSLDSYAGGLALDSGGNAFILGMTDSTDFPTTQSSFQGVYGGGGLDVFVMKVGANSAPAVSISPESLQFATQEVGSSSQPQLALLRNMGSSALSISSISTIGDFAESDNCGTSVFAAGSCTLSVIFTPTASGSRSGSVVIQDDAAGSPHTVSLSGGGSGPDVIFSLSSLSFSTVQTGSSAAQSLRLANNGNVTLSINTIQVTGDFAQTNNCSTSVPANSSCTINVTFTPTLPGARNGTLTINDNAPGNPQTLNLTGVGSDFGLMSSTNSQIAKPGVAVSYQVTVTPVGGPFTGTVRLSCGDLPASAACSLSPSSVIPVGNPVKATLTITTAANTSQLPPLNKSTTPLTYALWLQMPWIGLIAGISSRRKRCECGSRFAILLAMLASLLLMVACAGGTGTAPQAQPTIQPGTYTIMVKGVSGKLQHSLPLTLTVR
jgi:hypothetical protein